MSGMIDSNTTLARISEAMKALVAAKTLDDVLQIRDQAEALRVYIKAASESLEAANAASEIKLRAERKAGEMLDAMEKNPGGGDQSTGNGVLPVPSLSDLGIDKMQSSRWQREARVDAKDFEAYLRDCQKHAREVTQAGLLKLASGAHVSNNSGNSEWYTPKEYADAVHEVMGFIDTDPCSCEVANDTVRAAEFYTVEQDGLQQEWHGCIYVNPPYGDGTVQEFAVKLLLELDEGRTTQAIFLVNNCTETRWFQTLICHAAAVCFPCGRISFWSPDRQSKTPLQGQAILYFGKNAKRFKRVFSTIGFTSLIQ
jgi:hypothetical protein